MDFSPVPDFNQISGGFLDSQSDSGASSILDLDLEFNNLDTAFGLVSTQSQPIELTGKDLQRFKYRADQMISNSRMKMRTIHEEAKKDREWALAIPKTPKYEGGPDITMPIIAGKDQGLAAHMRDAIEQRPLASITPAGIGLSDESATNIAPLCEAYLEREINRTNSREIVASAMPKEVAEVGTSLVELSLTEIGGETYIQLGNIIRIENFYCDRINVDTLAETSCWYEYKERHYELEDAAELGIYDRDAIDVMASASSNAKLSQEEENLNFNEGDTFAEENSLRDLIRGFMRFRPDGEKETYLYEFVRGSDNMEYLSIRRTKFTMAFNAPPIGIARIGKRAGTLFGRGLGRRLEAQQKMADKYINNHLAATDFMGSPPYLYRANSAIGNAIERTSKRGLLPGQAIPTIGMPNVRDIEPLQLFNSGSGFNLQNVDIATRFSDVSTFAEAAIGSDSGSSRKTLGQFQIEVQNGTLRLRSDLSDFAYDMAIILKMYWASVVAFKIIPSGVVEIEDGGKLIAVDDIDADELSVAIARILNPLTSTGRLDMETASKFQAEYNSMLTNGMIPGVRRPDMSISLSGTRVIADKVSELQLQFQLLPTAVQLFEGARQDSVINYWLRSLVIAAGFKDVDKRVPADPNATVDPATRSQLLAPYMQMLQTSSNMI
jgi:hypothetical protein